MTPSSLLSFAPDQPQPARSSTWLDSSFAAWLGAMSALFGLANALGWSIGREQVDFRVYLMGARHLASPSLYDTVLTGWPYLPFTYPPFATLGFWPLCHLPILAAELIWDVLNWLMIVSIVAVALRSLRPRTASDGAQTPWVLVGLLVGPAVLLEPVMLTLSFGQVNLLLVAMVLTDLTGTITLRGHRLPRGILVGTAAAIKLVPLIFIPFLLITRQWRGARNATLTFLVCAAVPALINPRASWQYWTFYINDQKRIGRLSYISNQSVLGALDRWSHHELSGLGVTVLELLVVALGIVVAWRLVGSGRTFAAVLVVADTGMLASPVTWCHHMVYVIPIILWLWWCPDALPFARVWAVVASALFFWAPMWHIPHDGTFDLRERGWHIVIGSAFAGGAMVFLLGIAAWSWRIRPTRRNPS